MSAAGDTPSASLSVRTLRKRAPPASTSPAAPVHDVGRRVRQRTSATAGSTTAHSSRAESAASSAASASASAAAAVASPAAAAAASAAASESDMTSSGSSVDSPMFFSTPAALRTWLQQHHTTSRELFVGMWKKSTGVASVHWPDVRDAALCCGWIDGVARGLDEQRHAQRITPRKVGSIWSNVNVQRFHALEAKGLMSDAGRAAFARRREDRTGVYAFENKDACVLPAEFDARLRADVKAATFFDAQPPGYRRNAIHHAVSAKRAETREQRLTELINDSAAGLRIKHLRRR